MKVFYSGVNLYGQFSIDNEELIVKEFSPIEIEKDEDLLFYSMSLTFNVFVTKQKIIVRGFFNGRPNQNHAIDFDVSTIKQIDCNENHILILTNNGLVWQLNVTGDNNFKQVTGFINTETRSDIINVLNDAVTKIYCGKTMNLALSNQGILYSIPTKIETDFIVESMACGQEHGILLSQDGKVYTWGTGTRGQLGHGDLEDQLEPQLVEALHGITIVKIAAGGWHSAALSREGDLYTWGWNANGQLGFYNSSVVKSSPNKSESRKPTSIDNESISVLTTPHPVDVVTNTLNTFVVDIACGMRHTIILLEDGSLYGTGLNKYFQLGNFGGQNIENICQMTLLTKNIGRKDQVAIMCGPYCSAYIVKSSTVKPIS